METRFKPLPPIRKEMTDLATLTSTTTATMDELRRRRQNIMERRIELLARQRHSTRFGVIRNMLSTPRPPTPSGSNRTEHLDYSWVKSIVLTSVYDAVREVEVSKPSRAKTKLYQLLHDQYEKLVKTFLNKAVKQKMVNEVFDDLWSDVIGKEINMMVKQCVGDITVAESLASTLILSTICAANKTHNPASAKISEDNMVCKSLMTELRAERERRKDHRIHHTLQLVQLYISGNGIQPSIAQAEMETFINADRITATHLRDIQCLEPLYLPNDFEKYCEAEAKQWEIMKCDAFDLPNVSTNSIINSISVSPSSKYAAISLWNSIIVVQVSSNKVIRKNSEVGEVVCFDWSAGDQYLLTCTKTGRVACWQVGGATSFGPPKTGKKEVVLELVKVWSFEARDLRIEEGNFAQEPGSELVHVPAKVYFYPLYTAWGTQPIIAVVCQNNEILRICNSESIQVLYPSEMPRYQDIQNITVSNLRLDIFKGHKAAVHSVAFKDEVSMLSFDEGNFILEWEYKVEGMDAYGYVTPKRYIVIGNEVQYTRLIKGIQSMFTKGNKTRQELLQAAKQAEDKFKLMKFGKSPYSMRFNEESGCQEETFVRSSPEDEVSGVVVIRKVLGKSLVSMKKRCFRKQSKAPYLSFGSSLSPCNSLITYGFLFGPSKFRRPHISFVTLYTADLSLINNKFYFPISEEIFSNLSTDPRKFSFTLTPPNYKTKSSYIIFKISQSVYIVSLTTSQILAASFDAMSLCTHNSAIITNKHISQSLAGDLKCAIWGEKLFVYGGSGVNQVLLLSSGTAPDGKLAQCAGAVDPMCRRFFSGSDLAWDGESKGECERSDLYQMCRDILFLDLL